MDRDRLTKILQKLDTDFNRYAYLYTVLESNVLVENAQAKLQQIFGEKVDNFVKPAKKRLVEENSHKFQNPGTAFWAIIIAGLIGLWAFATISYVGIFSFRTLIFFACCYVVWEGVKSFRSNVDSETVKKLRENCDYYETQLNEMVMAKAKELYLENFNQFLTRPEVKVLIEEVNEQIQNYLQEFMALDFSNYQLLPKMYQDNQSVNRALYYLQTGQASDWKDCARLLSEEDYKNKQMAEFHSQTLNQTAMLNNQQTMIQNQRAGLKQLIKKLSAFPIECSVMRSPRKPKWRR
ncbi:hypothetical protein [uncultured Limosilactobacillus sp.]|uniref:hypothetical protein n=1 Tax=uncultured Limosilactobacillus sp. TaxID=2837629 RepID=UPI0025FF6A5B|nr:hypothetical protein [uncultured Limosilactobacillus sp.]